MDNLQQRIDEVIARYQPEIDRIQRDGEELGENEPGKIGVVIGSDVDVQWRDRLIAFNLPTVTMRERRISLDLPEVSRNRQRIVFDIPTVVMETWCAFKRPVWRKWKMKMECVYMDKPVVRMKRHEIIYDIPAVTMRRKDMVLKIPEFGSNRHEIKLKLPEFTLKNTRAELRQLEDKGEELRQRGEELGRAMEQEINALVGGALGEAGSVGSKARQELEAQFNEGIAQLEASIKELTAQNVDPVKVPAEGGNINLRQAYAQLIEERDRALAAFDAAIASDGKEEEQAAEEERVEETA
ncbi:MAG TPA: hypothetical protein VEZ41_05180 [Allosphingosinicella sp.]|nr:hypothetical protein [Allosphingosinicella sp.]